ncbi:MAG: CHAT domain-containing protein [Thermodesulfobacteriota bacterium]
MMVPKFVLRAIQLIHTPFRISILVAVAAMMASCAGALVPKDNALYYASRFQELETYMESQIPNPASADTSKLVYLCSAYFQLKKYNKLFPCLDQADSNCAKGDRGGLIVGGDISYMLKVIRADAYIELTHYDKAIETAKEAYDYVLEKRFGEQTRIYPLNPLALAYALKGDRARSQNYLKILEETSSGFMGAIRTTKLMGIARVHMALGDYLQALSVIQQDDSLAMLRSMMEAATVVTGAVSPGDSPFAYEQLPRLFILNKCLYETGRLAEAKRGYEQLMALPQTQSRGGIYWIILFDYGRILEREGNRDGALEYYRRAIDLIEQQRSTINAESSKIGFVGDKQQVYEQIIALLAKLGRSEEAFSYVERAKSRALVDMLAGKKDFAIAGSSADQVNALLAKVDDGEMQSHAIDNSAAAQTRGIVVEARSQLTQRAPELASLVTVTAPNLSDIQKRLQPSESLIEYYYGAASSEFFAFIVTASGIRMQTLDGRGLVDEVQLFRKAIENAKGDDWQEPAKRLHTRLIAPIQSLPGSGQLTVVAHGALHYLPFNALYDGRQFLIERYRLRMLPAASVLSFLKGGVGHQVGNVLAFGNPDLNDSRFDLEFAQAEAEAIAQSMPRSRALTRKAASKTAFRQYAAGFSYLHIASHGKFDPSAPLSSALLLAADGPDNGLLTVGELYSMQLAADLATLSACETGLSRIESGDDIVGLTRGFLYAGARSVVASLWQVDDQATGDLMKAFYAALHRGVGKAEGMRQAQLDTLRAYSHPFYWAAFQLTGDDR